MKKINIAYNGTLNRTTSYLGDKVYDKTRSWWGSAVYLNYDLSKAFGLSLRQEYFNDDNHLKVFGVSSLGSSIMATTVSANFRTANLTFIPEIRLDKASEAIFCDADGIGRKWAANILFAAIYQF